MKIQNNVKLSIGLSFILAIAFFAAGFGPEWLLDSVPGYLLAISVVSAMIQVVFIFLTSRFWKLVPLFGFIIAIISAAYFGVVMQLTGIVW